MNKDKYTHSNYIPDKNTRGELENLNKEKEDMSNFEAISDPIFLSSSGI